MLSQVVEQVIDYAEKIQNYWDIELPRRHPSYPLIISTEDSGPPPPEEQQFRDYCAKLPPDDIYQIMLLMYLGRGDYSTRELAHQFHVLKQTFASPKDAVQQMMSKGSLAEYLLDGLDELKSSGVDINHLLVSPVTSDRESMPL